jgi:signal transduction histidine kinase
MQVLLNLLSNAAKFVPAEGGRVEMRLTTDARA